MALAKRSLIKTWRTPEALIDVTLQPVLFLIIFVYVFGGAVAGSTHDYLQFLLPGILAQTIATGAIAIGVNLNTDIAKGIFDRFRSLPIPAPHHWSARSSATSSGTSSSRCRPSRSAT
ncbi:ABC transporter permease [Micromonospora sp. M12]